MLVNLDAQGLSFDSRTLTYYNRNDLSLLVSLARDPRRAHAQSEPRTYRAMQRRNAS
jgi:hypothetical protein